MFTTVGWANLMDPNGDFTPCLAIPDQHVRTELNSIFIQEFNLLLGGMALIGAAAGQARFVAPSLRRVNPQAIEPLETAIVQAGVPIHAVSPRTGIQLDQNEQLQFESNPTLAGAQEQAGYAWLADARITPVEGQIRTIRFVIATVVNSVIHGWVNAELDFIDDLPIGVYDIVGAGLFGASIRCYRFVPIGAHHRPGGPGAATNEQGLTHAFRYGDMGVWLTFETVRPPSIDVSTSAVVALANTEGFIDVIAR